MPETPEQWRDVLLKKLENRLPVLARLQCYYDGAQDKPALPQGCSRDLQALRDNAMLNLCDLVVHAPVERLSVDGFQFGKGSDATDVWRDIWQPNRLDLDSELVHVEALTARIAAVLIWPDTDRPDVPAITPESASEVYVEYFPGSRRKRRAAIKSFVEGEGAQAIQTVTVWLPETVTTWTRLGHREWIEDVEMTGPNPLGVVPVVEFRANPKLGNKCYSELDRGAIQIQNRINKTIFDRLVLQEFHAFPQRWATGVAPAMDDDGNVVQPFFVGPNKIVTNESDEVKFGQWDAADLKPLLDAAEAEILALATKTVTPTYYLGTNLSNVSAEMLRALEAGLVKKTERHQRVFGESWEEVIRLALKARGDDRWRDEASLIEWSSPETRTMAEEADATVKLAPFLPQAETWRRLGYSPQDRERFREEMMTESLLAAEPTPEPVPEPAPVG